MKAAGGGNRVQKCRDTMWWTWMEMKTKRNLRARQTEPTRENQAGSEEESSR